MERAAVRQMEEDDDFDRMMVDDLGSWLLWRVKREPMFGVVLGLTFVTLIYSFLIFPPIMIVLGFVVVLELHHEYGHFKKIQKRMEGVSHS